MRIGITSTFILLTILFFTACAQAPNYTYVADYQVIGDRTVKYIYVPGETSQAGDFFLDQSIGLEVCTIRDPEAIARDGEERVEKECRSTRILRTQEYR